MWGRHLSLEDARFVDMAERFVDALPDVPLEQLDLFIDRVVLASALPCALDDPIPELRNADHIGGRISLTEDEQFLCRTSTSCMSLMTLSTSWPPMH